MEKAFIKDPLLRQVLEGMAAFERKESLIKYYVEYEYEHQKSYLMEFWESVL